jgi:hypothetical protein
MKNILILIISLFSLTSYSQTFYGYEVCDFNQGLTNIGTNVSTNRSNPNKSLGIPQNTDIETGNINFVSLGFGGDITLKISNKIEITPSTTLNIYETTYGYTSCNVYDEEAKVYISKNNINFFLVGETCLNNNTVFNLSQTGLDSVLYVKIVDISDPSKFSHFTTPSDGYDLDGISIFNIGPLPIVLKYFNVNYRDNNLFVEFTTASESNTDKFIIQSSIDASKFEDVCDLKAAGYSSFDRYYDKKLIFEPKNNVTYFRLVELDYNGEYYYFDIIPVNTTNKSIIDNYYYDLLGRRATDDSIFKIKGKF